VFVVVHDLVKELSNSSNVLRGSLNYGTLNSIAPSLAA